MNDKAKINNAHYFIYLMGEDSFWIERIEVIGVPMMMDVVRLFGVYMPEIRVTDTGDNIVMQCRAGKVVWPDNLEQHGPPFLLREFPPDLLDDGDLAATVTRLVAEYKAALAAYRRKSTEQSWFKLALTEAYLMAVCILHNDVHQAASQGFIPTYLQDNVRPPVELAA